MSASRCAEVMLRVVRDPIFRNLEAKESVAAEGFSAADLRSALESRQPRSFQAGLRVRVTGTANAPSICGMALSNFSSAVVDKRRSGQEAWRKVLLVCGIASSVLFALMIWAIRYPGYNPFSQVPSELTAIGAPTRALWTRLGWIYTALETAFGFGLWKWAGRNRAVRVVGGLILAHASLGLLWPFAAMHQREVLAAGGGTLSDTVHVVLGGVTVFLMFLAIGFGATAFGKPFRLYSIATIVVLLTFGALTFIEAPRLQANLPTPWIGLWERINISVFLLWVAVLAAALLRRGTSQETRIMSRLRSTLLKVKQGTLRPMTPR